MNLCTWVTPRKSLIRDRIEGPEKDISFTINGKNAILTKWFKQRGLKKSSCKICRNKKIWIRWWRSTNSCAGANNKTWRKFGCKGSENWNATWGRLNVLAKCNGKPYKAIFSEFFGKSVSSKKDFEGDVKYHLGASANREFDGNTIHISLTDNPSHLEAVNPRCFRSNKS